MKENIKGLILIIVAIAAAVCGYFILSSEYRGYSILCFTCAVIISIFGVRSMLNSTDPMKAYESNIKSILNTFDSILVKITSVPKLIGRNIILVEDMDDMVDAQLEIRKPICYYKQTESCSFVLLDDKEAYVYIEKLNPEIISPVEIEINDIKLKQKNSEDLDSEMLKDIEKTTIVKLSNKKSYKVSPIKKENKFKFDENKNSETNKNVVIEDMEII